MTGAGHARHFDPSARMLGGYPPGDGVVEYYSRINALIEPEFTVLDLGAGRGMWYFEDPVEFRRELRSIKGRVAEFIGADVDEVVLTNPTTDRNIVIQDGVIPLPDCSVDLVLCDFVLEHVLDVAAFKAEVDRIVKPGGYFCARTPHTACYVSLAARLVRNESHAHWLRKVQPTKRSQDVFPTAYRLNTLRAIRRVFANWDDHSYIFCAAPSYYFGRKIVFHLLSGLHRIAPRWFSGCLFVFLVKR